MKVLFDYQSFCLTKYGGISRYFSELMDNFNLDTDICWDIALCYSDNEYLLKKKLVSGIKPKEETCSFMGSAIFRGKSRIHKTLTYINLAKNPFILNKRMAVSIIKKGDFDIFHPTYYDNYFLKHLSGRPFIITIHDMIHEIYTGVFFDKNDITINQKRLCAERANRIIAVSENTKKDIVRIYGISEDKISVIYHGSSLDPKKQNKANNIKLPEKYLLYVGDRHTYKNFAVFLQSVSPLLLNDNAEIMIVCAGSVPFTENEKRLLVELNLNGRVIHKIVNDDNDLINCYQNAICFVFPSLYEGFGIPILEAFSCGCPVALSNSGSFKEIAGDAAVYFNPKNAKSIKEAIERVIYDEHIRDKLILQGKARGKKFSWEKCAIETKNLYKSILLQ